MTTTESNDRGKSESTDSQTPQKLRQFLNEELNPAVMDLHISGEDIVDEKQAYTKFLLKAAEAGALAESTLLSGNDARGRAVRHAREALFAATSLVLVDDPGRHTQTLEKDASLLVDAVEDLDPEASISEPDVSHVDDRDTHWKKHAAAGVASVKLDPFLLYEFNPEDDLDTLIQLHPSDPGEVNVGFRTTGEVDGNDLKLGTISRLTPDQAEDLAAGLLECAEDARAQQEAE